jgi:hypothetical protein
MVAARKIVPLEQQEQHPTTAMVSALKRLWSKLSDANGNEIIPGAANDLNDIHEAMQRFEAMEIGQNAALAEMKRQRDELLRESVELNHHGYKRANEEIIRDISASYGVTPAVAEFLLNILTGAIDENGDYFVNTYAVNQIREAVEVSAGEIQEAIAMESQSLFDDEDYDEEYDDDDDE